MPSEKVMHAASALTSSKSIEQTYSANSKKSQVWNSYFTSSGKRFVRLMKPWTMLSHESSYEASCWAAANLSIPIAEAKGRDAINAIANFMICLLLIINC